MNINEIDWNARESKLVTTEAYYDEFYGEELIEFEVDTDWNVREKEMVAKEYSNGEYGDESLTFYEVEIGNISGFRSKPPSFIFKVAQKGGRIAHAMGRAHKFTPEEAKTYGAKGGQKTRENKSGIFARTPEQRRIDSSKAGRANRKHVDGNVA